MSLGECGERNLLVRDGAAQNRRALPALHPRRARLDERGIAELLLFTGRYAEQIQYWNAGNAPDGNFASFVRSDPSYLIAELAVHRTDGLIGCWAEARSHIRDSEAEAIKETGALNLLFNLLFNEMVTVDRWLRTARHGLEVHEAISRQVSGVLRGALASACVLHRWLADEGLMDELAVVEESLCADDPRRDAIWRTAELEGIWFGPDAPGRALAEFIDGADTESLDITASEDAERMREAAERLAPAFQALLQATSQLADTAPAWLAETLTAQADHAPQMALWLGFARMFRHAQAALNHNTRRHLDFHYERVLRLSRRGPVGDRAHVVFTLARHADSLLLPAGTELRAGEDAEGLELRYRLSADAALNRAAIAEPGDLKSVFFDKSDGYRPYAASVAASADGRGADFAADAEPRWQPFGRSQRTQGGFLAPDRRTMAFAEPGFAVSSPELLLREGERTITLRFTPSLEPDETGLSAEQLRVRWTGEKGWEEAHVASLVTSEPELLHKNDDGGELRLVLVLRLGADAPALVAHDDELHGAGYHTAYPVLEIRLANNEGVAAPAFGLLRAVEVTRLELEVKVVGIRGLMLQNDFGVLDAAKPFEPFGTQPLEGASFYIGSDEAFRKHVERLRLDWTWQAPPSADLGSYLAAYYDSAVGNAGFVARWEALDGNVWRGPSTPEELALFDALDAAAPRNDVPLVLEGLSLAEDRAARWREPRLDPYHAGSGWGFLRLRLGLAGGVSSRGGDVFGHAQYPRLYAEAALRYAAMPSGSPSLPNPPWTPVIESLTLGYTAKVSVDLAAPQDGPETFWHVYPFGQRPAHAAGAATPLLPRFEHGGANDAADSTGELYLGLSGLAPRQNLSLLVQVAEGSADPEVPHPEVRWWYWSDAGWVRFNAEQILRDDTGGLVRSGLLVLDVPAQAQSGPGLLPAGRHWLRATVGGDPRGVCDLLAVRAQAAEVQLVEPANHQSHLELPLPADTITALAEKHAAVKRVEQPYASFGNRPAEKTDAYHTRVSERLRHKDRAITMWDYERLVLERFPSVYKAKCINHSTYAYRDRLLSIRQSEFAPGWVTVVVIPDLRNKNAVDPLEPRASLAVLDEIRRYLARRMTPWAARRLRVINPFFERIAIKCKVGFVEGADFGIHRARLAGDVTRFLSPWAFPEEGGADISFGGTVHRSSLLHFMEKLAYVDFVTDFEMLHSAPGMPPRAAERTVPGSARSVFASAPRESHVIGDARC